MKKSHRIIVSLILILVLCTSVVDTMAQSDDQPLDDEFVEALVMMAVNHNMMEGEDELTHLSALHDVVSGYYDIRIYDTHPIDAVSLKAKKESLLAIIEDEMAIKSNLGLLNTFLTIFTDAEVINITRDSMGFKRFVSGSDDPPGDYFETMNSLIMTDFETQVNLLLDIDTITVQPNLTTVINDHSSWSLNVPAISNSYAPISLPAAGVAGSADSSSKNNELFLKPVRFVNNGYEPVTVVVSMYTPASGLDASIPSASTVVFPGSNSSAYLELPLGIYSFCYSWQLDQDTNNDGTFDYHHYNTDMVTLDENTPDNIESARSVTLIPDTSVSNPNGKCGEDLAPIYTQPPNPAPPAIPDNDGLTPEEAANAGTHIYYVTDDSGYEGYETITINFSGNSVNIINHKIGSDNTFTREGSNRYSEIKVPDLNFTIITFSSDGYLWNFGNISYSSHTLTD